LESLAAILFRTFLGHKPSELFVGQDLLYDESIQNKVAAITPMKPMLSIHQRIGIQYVRVGLLLTVGFGMAIGLSPNLAASAQTLQSVNIPLEPVRPSLWWMVQRLEDGWVDDLMVNYETKKVVITVNRSRWFAADYLRRYEFLNKLGLTALQDAYGVLLQDNRQNKLAEYIAISDRWQMEPQSLGAVPFRVNTPTLYQNINR
jgi:hypothetical protein